VRHVIAFILFIALSLTSSCAKKIKVGPDDARTIAREAYIYGLPIVENYKVMYAYAVYRDGEAFRAPFNALAVITPDTAQADSTRRSIPHSSFPYAMSWLDLRKEPVVITVPPIDEGREFHVQLVDLYTFNFDELGTSTTGNAGGSYMIVGGLWAGETPKGVTRVTSCETEFALALIRMQPIATDNNEAIEKRLLGFSVEPKSVFEGKRPEQSDALIFPPYSTETAMSAGFFQYLNFALQFCPVHPNEIQERARFAKLGIEGGKSFSFATMDRDVLAAINEGIADARAEISEAAAKTSKGSARYGTRAQLEQDFLARAVAAKSRLYGPARF
jgi:hypothetical protein